MSGQQGRRRKVQLQRKRTGAVMPWLCREPPDAQRSLTDRSTVCICVFVCFGVVVTESFPSLFRDNSPRPIATTGANLMPKFVRGAHLGLAVGAISVSPMRAAAQVQ